MIRRFERETLAGFVSPGSFLQPSGLELLKQDGSVAMLPYAEIKTVCFVKDFDQTEVPLEGKVFNTRPKMDGLWVRMTFRDGEVSDGLLPNNLLQLDRYGFTVIPPEPYSNNQRFFIPRQALTGISVLGVVGSPLNRDKPKGRRKTVPKEQTSLFE
ncbi:MAG: hypothetical protein M3Z23_04675 [Acidobacteriota bacterium]|nr:hypothetical protein [Acidobacteriota bacterium]